MKPKLAVSLMLVVALLLGLAGTVLAADYSFSLDKEVVNVYWNANGTMAIDYVFVFTNKPTAKEIDAVDVGMPNSNYNIKNVRADVDGKGATRITDSPYVKPGVAVELGSNAIRPGRTGTIHLNISEVRNVLYTDSTDSTYASAVFSPTWFSSQFVSGKTDLTVTFHLPPNVQPNEPRYHKPSSWPGNAEPQTGFDEQNRIIYTWQSNQANGYTQYKFGASFPKKYVAADSIQKEPGAFEQVVTTVIASISGIFGSFTSCCPFVLFFLFFIGSPILSYQANQKRKLKYLPPKISVEGHGIKRGLTAVEAAILMEQPVDKVMTMILFGVIKKGVASVKTREPLELEIRQPLPDNLYTYEKLFLQAFSKTDKSARKEALQDMIVELIKTVSAEMKGFSRSETVAYYEDIMRRAWSQVEAAQTPEIKGQAFDQNLEWTMLDKDFNNRTRDVFQQGPIFVPIWWWHYDPGYRGSMRAPSTSSSQPGTSWGPASGTSLPSLPGSSFAASVVGGIESFSSGVVGNLTSFTSGITQETNPIPVSRSSSGGSGGCACACACAGCACACAGGGR